MNCFICKKPVAKLTDARLIVTHGEHDHAAEIEIKEIIEAAKADEKSMYVLRDEFDKGILEFITR